MNHLFPQLKVSKPLPKDYSTPHQNPILTKPQGHSCPFTYITIIPFFHLNLLLSAVTNGYPGYSITNNH